MRSAAGHRVYEDFVPSHELVREETAGTLTVDLPGYKKEQIKVMIDKNGKLKISGERPLDEDNRWSRFRREFQVPDNCNVSDIRAKFENGHLHVILPKLTTEVKGQEKPTRAPKKPEESREPATEPKPSTGQDDMNQKTPVKPNGGVTKKQEDEKRGEPMDARKDEQKAVEKVKDRTEEKKYNEKVTGVVKREEGEKGDAVTDVQKKEAVPEPAAAGNGGNGEAKLKQKLDELGLGCYDPRQMITASAIVAALVLVGMGLYVSYKLSTMEEDGN